MPGKNYTSRWRLRGYYPDAETFEWMRKNEFRYHTMAEIEKRGWDAVLEDVIKEARDGPEYLFISFDIDTIDPGFAPGTGTPEPGGLNPAGSLFRSSAGSAPRPMSSASTWSSTRLIATRATSPGLSPTGCCGNA